MRLTFGLNKEIKMSKKIVAIGGGENGRLKEDGTRYPYELEPQDREIIRLTGKEHPIFYYLRIPSPSKGRRGIFRSWLISMTKGTAVPAKT